MLTEDEDDAIDNVDVGVAGFGNGPAIDKLVLLLLLSKKNSLFRIF